MLLRVLVFEFALTAADAVWRTGEKVDIAELGLSGKLRDDAAAAAAAAFFRAAMASFNDVAALGFVEDVGPTLAVKDVPPETG